MGGALDAIFKRRAIKDFEPVDISREVRQQILDAARHAPSSFNSQPYRFYWVQSAGNKATVAKFCLGQKPAETASALVVAVADIGSLSDTSRAQSAWMRRTNFSEETVRRFERHARMGRILFIPGPFGMFALLKRALFRMLHMPLVIGMPPLSRQELFKWATKSTSLACQNVMIATEALGMNSCPMEGFDGRRLGRYLNLSDRHHEIVMVIAIGRKARGHHEPPQWRRSIESSVTFL